MSLCVIYFWQYWACQYHVFYFPLKSLKWPAFAICFVCNIFVAWYSICNAWSCAAIISLSLSLLLLFIRMFVVIKTASYKHFEWAEKRPGKARRGIFKCFHPHHHIQNFFTWSQCTCKYSSLTSTSPFKTNDQIIQPHKKKKQTNNSCTSLPAGVCVC